MRPTLLLLFACIITVTAFGQEERKEYKNEFGLDATGFIRSILNFNIDPTFQMPYAPTYFLSYRRKFKPGNIRFAIGGAYGREDVPSVHSDTTMFQRNHSAINVRLGWEFTTELSKRWQAYYGLDLRATFTHSYNEVQFYNAGYANGRENRNEILGVAPLLGFRFRINDRISILAEGSFSLNWAKADRRDFFTPVNDTYPEKPDKNPPTIRSTYTLFAQPLSIFLCLIFDGGENSKEIALVHQGKGLTWSNFFLRGSGRFLVRISCFEDRHLFSAITVLHMKVIKNLCVGKWVVRQSDGNHLVIRVGFGSFPRIPLSASPSKQFHAIVENF